MSTMRMNPETGYPEIMPDTRIPPGGHTLGRIDPNFNPSNTVVPGIGGQSLLQGLPSTSPSYATTTNANMTGTAAPSSSQGSFLSGMFGQLGGGSTPQPQQPGLAGLQQQPAGVQDQIQQLQSAQAPANYRSLPRVNQFEGQPQQTQNAQQPSQQQMQQMQAFQQQMQEQIARQEQTPQQQQMQGMQTSQPQSNRRAYDPVGMQREPQGNLMQLQQQRAGSTRDQMSDRDRFIEGQFQGNQDLPQAQIDAMRSQFGNTFDAQGGQLQFGGDFYAPGGPLGGPVENFRRPTAPVPRPPKAEGLGVSSFGGASSNDMQRMLNRGSISGNNMGDVQNQIGEMEAAAAPQPKPPHPFLSEPRQFPFNPLLNKTTPTDGLPLSTAGGIMGQAPPEMAQNIPLMQNQMAPVPGYGLPPVPQTSAGMGFSPPPMNPMQGGYGSAGMMGMAPPGMAQMAAFPQQTMQQGGYAPMQQVRGSQNSPPIQSPFV